MMRAVVLDLFATPRGQFNLSVLDIRLKELGVRRSVLGISRWFDLDGLTSKQSVEFFTWTLHVLWFNICLGHQKIGEAP